MKPLRILAVALACILLPACALTPTTVDQGAAVPTSRVSIAMDTIASAIRHAEAASFTPAQFNNFLDSYVALLPPAVPYIPDTKLAYAALYTGGQASITGLEFFAARYDTQ